MNSIAVLGYSRRNSIATNGYAQLLETLQSGGGNTILKTTITSIRFEIKKIESKSNVIFKINKTLLESQNIMFLIEKIHKKLLLDIRLNPIIIELSNKLNSIITGIRSIGIRTGII